MKSAPDIVAENAWKTQGKDRGEIDKNALLPAPAEIIHAAGYEILEDRRDRRETRKCHEQEKQGAPETAACHAGEDVRQCDENQRRPLIGFYIVAVAGRENDEARHNRNKCVKRADIDCLARQRVLLRHIAAEDFHRRDAETQGEEGLIHRRRDDFAEAAGLLGPRQGRLQIELQPFRRTRKSEAVNRKNNDQQQERDHHDLRHSLQPLLNSASDHKKSKDNREPHEDRHLRRVF